MTTTARKRTLGSLLAGLLLVALIPAGAAAATPITFNLYLGESCIRGQASGGAAVSLVWRKANGTLKARATVRATDWGSWSYCSPEGAKILKVGDRLKASVGTATHKLVIPTLTLNADRAKNLFKGRAPAGSTLELNYHAGIIADYYEQANVRTRSDGTWSYRPYSTYDLMGGIHAEMRWGNGHGDEIWVSDTSPFFRVIIGKPAFAGLTRPGRSVTITVRNGVTNVVKATGTAVGDRLGNFAGRFRNSAGKLVPLAVGDRFNAPTIASDANWIVPRVVGTANVATDVVSGRCFDSGTSQRYVEIRVVRGGILRGYAINSTAGDGSFEIEFDAPDAPWFRSANIKHGDRITVSCLQESGDWAGMKFIVP